MSCGLYDKNTLIIEDFARFAVALGIHSVGFWNLSTWKHDEFPYDNTDVAESDRVYPLDSLAADERRPRMDAIRRAIGILNANGVIVQVNANFLDAPLGESAQAPQRNEDRDSLRIPEGKTRDCLDPWNYFEIDTNGDVKPCCARGSVGNIAHSDLAQILDGEPIRRLRTDLLNGTLDSDCIQCPLRGVIEPVALEDKIRGLLAPDFARDKKRTSLDGPSTAAAAKVANLLSGALAHLEEGRKTTAWDQVCAALAIDPAIQGLTNTGDATIRTHLAAIVAGARFPSTLTWLAAICREIHDHQACITFMERYLEIAPDAPDRQHVLTDLRREKRLILRIALSHKWQALRRLPQNVWTGLRLAVRFRSRMRAMLGRL